MDSMGGGVLVGISLGVMAVAFYKTFLRASHSSKNDENECELGLAQKLQRRCKQLQQRMKDLRLSKESTVRQSKQAMKLVFCYTLCNIIQNNLKNRLKRHAIIASQSQTNDQTGQMQEYLKVLLAQVDDSKAMATRTKKRAYSLMGITNHISQLHSKQLDNYKNQLKTAGYTLVEGIDSLSLQQTRTVLITLIAYYREKGRDLAERLAACLKQGVEWQRMSQVVSLVVIDQALVGMEWVDELQIQKGKGKFSEELRKELMEVEREEEAFFEVMSKKVVR